MTKKELVEFVKQKHNDGLTYADISRMLNTQGVARTLPGGETRSWCVKSLSSFMCKNKVQLKRFNKRNNMHKPVEKTAYVMLEDIMSSNLNEVTKIKLLKTLTEQL